MKLQPVATIDEYIASHPVSVQTILQKLRQTIHDAAPEATEAIAYGLATFRLNNKNLVHFGAYEAHVGFYPAPSGIGAFKAELEPYIAGKGTLRFPIEGPIPYDLVRRVTLFRAQEILAKKK